MFETKFIQWQSTQNYFSFFELWFVTLKAPESWKCEIEQWINRWIIGFDNWKPFHYQVGNIKMFTPLLTYVL